MAGRYRSRRHACLSRTSSRATLTRVAAPRALAADDLQRAARRPRALVRAGRDGVAASPAWTRLLIAAGRSSSRRCAPVPRWYIEAHQFRIDTAVGHRPAHARRRAPRRRRLHRARAGRARPRGRWRDPRLPGRTGPRRALHAREPWSALLLDDARVVHETTPIQSATGAAGVARHAGADLPSGGLPGPRIIRLRARLRRCNLALSRLPAANYFVGPRYLSYQSSVARTSWLCGSAPWPASNRTCFFWSTGVPSSS